MDVRVFLFQATRELLFNVVKHAMVNRAEVHLEGLPDGRARITVSDRGVGFAVATPQPEQATLTSFGMFNIREHIEWLGGTMEVTSAEGQGTSVSLTVPHVEPTEKIKPPPPALAPQVAAAAPPAGAVETLRPQDPRPAGRRPRSDASGTGHSRRQ